MGYGPNKKIRVNKEMDVRGWCEEMRDGRGDLDLYRALAYVQVRSMIALPPLLPVEVVSELGPEAVWI